MQKEGKKEGLGVDMGGVIFERKDDVATNSFFAGNYRDAKEAPQALGSLRALAHRRFGDRIYLISKCDKDAEQRILEWLQSIRFFEFTDIPSGNVHFVRERREKAGICKDLGITHFIDDRLEVLSHLTMVEKRFLYRPDAKEMQPFIEHLGRVKQVNSWQEIRRELLP